MFEEIGERELDTTIGALEMLKIYKIQSNYNDYKNECSIGLTLFDREFNSYNECYGIVQNNIFESIIKKISSKITMEEYDADEFSFITTNDTEISDEEKEDILNDTHIVVIPVKTKNSKKLIAKFKKVVNSVGNTEEYFDDVVFYNNNCISIVVDKSEVTEVLIESDLIELLYECKRNGVLLC